MQTTTLFRECCRYSLMSLRGVSNPITWLFWKAPWCCTRLAPCSSSVLLLTYVCLFFFFLFLLLLDVGNKAAVFPLQLLGFEVDVINSVHFSNHTGYSQGWEGDVLKGDQLRLILDGLQRNQLLDGIQHVLTGYIGSETFLEAILDVITAARMNGNVRYVCDPVLGDHGEFYVPQNLVEVYKEKLLPIADVLTPNQFEVEQLTGIKVNTLSSAKKACATLHAIGPSLVFITSCVFSPENGDDKDPKTIAIVASRHCPRDDMQKDDNYEQWILEVPIIPGIYTGTGDLTAALLLAHTAKFPNDLARAMEMVSNTMHAVIERTRLYSGESIKSRELKLIQSRGDIENPVLRFRARRL